MTEREGQDTRGRFASLDWRSAVIAAVAAVTGIVALATVSDPAPQPSRYRVDESQDIPVAISGDPLGTELARCRTLPANAEDARCSAAWEVNRRRFMGESRSLVLPAVPTPTLDLAPSPATQPTER